MDSPLFADVAADKIAYRMTASGESVTYGQLEARTNQVEQLFRALGLKPGDPVALFLEHSALSGDRLGRAAQLSDLYAHQFASDSERSRLHSHRQWLEEAKRNTRKLTRGVAAGVA